MLVLVDVEKSEVTVYSDSDKMRAFSMQDTNGIAAAICGHSVYYVTSAEEVSGDEVVEMLSSLTGIPHDNTIDVSVQNHVSVQGHAKTEDHTDKKYIHPKSNKQITVRTESGKQILFSGITDIKNCDYIPQEIMKSNQMKMFLDNDALEVITHQEKESLLQNIENMRQAMRRKQEERESKSSILVQSSEPGSAEKFASEGTGEDFEDAISINISGEKSFKMTNEHAENMKKLGLE